MAVLTELMPTPASPGAVDVLHDAFDPLRCRITAATFATRILLKGTRDEHFGGRSSLNYAGDYSVEGAAHGDHPASLDKYLEELDPLFPDNCGDISVLRVRRIWQERGHVDVPPDYRFGLVLSGSGTLRHGPKDRLLGSDSTSSVPLRPGTVFTLNNQVPSLRRRHGAAPYRRMVPLTLLVYGKRFLD